MTASIPIPSSIDLLKQQLKRKSILQRYLSNLEYTPTDIDPTNVELEALMRSEMESRNIQCVQLERTLHLSASLIELAYPECSLAEKKNIALYNWYVIYVDDMSTTDPVALNEFQQRFLRGQEQLNPVLTAFADVLMNVWDLYDPLFANTIITSTFEFITSNCIEPSLETTPLVQGVQRFPWFIREKSGTPAGYALQLFPKSRNLSIMDIVQALPDMYYWINMSNDLLSFHKEELEGEKNNYIHIRANAENSPPLEVLARMTEELQTSRDTIHKVLEKSPSTLNCWKAFERGVIQWHMIGDRYKLGELEL